MGENSSVEFPGIGPAECNARDRPRLRVHYAAHLCHGQVAAAAMASIMTGERALSELPDRKKHEVCSAGVAREKAHAGAWRDGRRSSTGEWRRLCLG